MAILVLAAAGGCSSIGHVIRGGTPNVWVGSDQTGAILVQMARTGAALSGTLDETDLANTDSPTLKAVHGAFTGAVDRKAITLTFPKGLGFSTSLSGTLTDDRLLLSVPQDTGTVATVTLQPGSVSSYNRLVATLSGRASANAAAQQVAAQQTAAADQAAAREAAGVAAENRTRQGVDAAAETVTNDLAASTSSLDNPPEFGDFNRTIASARDHLAAAMNDAETAANGDRSQACSTAYRVQDDVYSLQSDSYSIDSNMVPITEYIRAVGWAVANIKRDFDAYHLATASASGYGPSDAAEETTIQKAINNANSTTADLNSRGNSDKSTVAKLVAQASTIANHAVKQYC